VEDSTSRPLIGPITSTLAASTRSLATLPPAPLYDQLHSAPTSSLTLYEEPPARGPDLDWDSR